MDLLTHIFVVGMGTGVAAALVMLFITLAHTWWLEHNAHQELGASVGLRQRVNTGRLQLVGERRGLPVDVHPVDEPGGSWTVIQAAGVPRRLVLAPAGRTTEPLLVATGDPAFDRLVHAAGPAAVVRAWLPEGTRDVLTGPMRRSADRWREHQLRVVGGQVRLRVQGSVHQAEELEALVDQVLRIAEVLREDDASLEERLIASVRADPIPEVRVRCLRALLERAPSPRIREVAAFALDCDDPRLQLVAARHLGHAATLAGLARAAWVEKDLRVAALHALADGDDRAAAIRAARRGLRADDDALRLAAVQLAGRWSAREALPELFSLLEHAASTWDRDDRRPLAVALARTLGRLQGAAVEQALLRLLEAPFLDVVAVACAGLAQVGRPTCIDPLVERSDHPDPTVRDAVRSALAAVRYREGAVEGGALSLVAGPEAGALTLADEGGALSLVDEQG